MRTFRKLKNVMKTSHVLKAIGYTLGILLAGLIGSCTANLVRTFREEAKMTDAQRTERIQAWVAETLQRAEAGDLVENMDEKTVHVVIANTNGVITLRAGDNREISDSITNLSKTLPARRMVKYQRDAGGYGLLAYKFIQQLSTNSIVTDKK